MIQQEKTNKVLGLQVRDYLITQGVETPVIQLGNNSLQKKEEIEQSFASIMKSLGLDLEDDSLKESPRRVSKMFIDELFYGLDYSNFPKCTTVLNKIKHGHMVIERDINATSTCEHHFVTIDGVCHVGYVPKDKIIGLSKLNRIVDFFCKRPQIQERLSEQIYHALSFILETPDIAVIIDSKHYCVKIRGIKDINSSTITSKLGGCFFETLSCREEFLNLISLDRRK